LDGEASSLVLDSTSGDSLIRAGGRGRLRTIFTSTLEAKLSFLKQENVLFGKRRNNRIMPYFKLFFSCTFITTARFSV